MVNALMSWSAAPTVKGKEKARSDHPYLRGNFYPVSKEHDLVSCEVHGDVPTELYGGQFLRNGGNAYLPPGKGEGYHFFDGDGMIHGVYFRKDGNGSVVPCYVNKFIQTDVLLATQKRGSAIIPSIASLIEPFSTYPVMLLANMLRTMSICYLSSISRLSVANTAVLFHNRKLLATCESGPMMRLEAPGLETKGWEVFYDEKTGEGLGSGKNVFSKKYGASAKMLEEWTTGHPKVCPVTGDLVFFGYNITAAPFVLHSVIKSDGSHSPSFKTPIPGIGRPKMMHDFGCSLHHSIILDLPLTMDPLNIVLARPMLNFNRALKSRFAIFPRYYDGTDTKQVRWFEHDAPSIIFHTADSWDEGMDGGQYHGETAKDTLAAVNMYACRFRTSALVYSAGGVPAPAFEEKLARETSDNVRLTYYRFSMSPEDPLRPEDAAPEANVITHAFSLSAVPLEYPVVNEEYSMQQHRYIYGCTSVDTTFDTALEGAKVDCIVKVDAEALRRKGMAMLDAGEIEMFDDVDKKDVHEILDLQEKGQPDDSVRIFRLAPGCYGQEPEFVPRKNAKSEDDGYLLFYVFDDAQLLPDGTAPESSYSQLYIIDALLIGLVPSEEAVICKINMPARIPFGLHSDFLTEAEIDSQARSGNINAQIIQDAVVEVMADDGTAVQPTVSEETMRIADVNERIGQTVQARPLIQLPAMALAWFAALIWAALYRTGLAHARPACIAEEKEPVKALALPAKLVRCNSLSGRSRAQTGDWSQTRKRGISITSRPHLHRLSSSQF